ncbi:MAG: beta-lactamase family protein, partial [Betaproteobacteria bacterium]|nr:beta-lactamase family protein [Betaproteobacteria bacterium]
MSALDNILKAGVASGAAPGLVAMTGNAAGVKWSGAAGERAPGKPMSADTVFRIFSMTKAIGSTAAMILIDRGKLKAEATVESILPNFAKIQVLDGFDGDKPRMRAPKSKATIRQLATHTSGLVYEFWNTDVPRWM